MPPVDHIGLAGLDVGRGAVATLRTCCTRCGHRGGSRPWFVLLAVLGASGRVETEPGSTHAWAVRFLRNVADWRGKAWGDPAGAAVALEELLTDQLRVLRAEHPHTLITRRDLEYWQKRTSDNAHG